MRRWPRERDARDAQHDFLGFEETRFSSALDAAMRQTRRFIHSIPWRGWALVASDTFIPFEDTYLLTAGRSSPFSILATALSKNKRFCLDLEGGHGGTRDGWRLSFRAGRTSRRGRAALGLFFGKRFLGPDARARDRHGPFAFTVFTTSWPVGPVDWTTIIRSFFECRRTTRDEAMP